VGRETDQEQRERKDSEMQEYRKERQLRLGHVVPEEESKEEETSEPEKTA
jgi:hypothetical protein